MPEQPLPSGYVTSGGAIPPLNTYCYTNLQTGTGTPTASITTHTVNTSPYATIWQAPDGRCFYVNQSTGNVQQIAGGVVTMEAPWNWQTLPAPPATGEEEGLNSGPLHREPQNRFNEFVIAQQPTPPPPPRPFSVIKRELADIFARRKAKRILLKHLNEEQRKTFDKKHQFIVNGSDGNRYNIRCNSHVRNVQRITQDPDGTERITELLCAHIGESENCPSFDHFLAQKFWLEADELTFRRLANISPVNYPASQYL